MQKIGMEWFFRLVQEPRRLFARYLVTNAQFMFLMSKHLLSGRGRRRSAGSAS
jgi:N-acetylglucosaminyldiphosphoundecaprenol N-acetyl-beta-D-mannosaminyltransferase